MTTVFGRRWTGRIISGIKNNLHKDNEVPHATEDYIGKPQNIVDFPQINVESR